MKKEEVYQLIKYNGIYNEQVKKNLKDLIKKYHPDKNKGDSKIIKIIYEVKKELENNKVSYNPLKKERKNNDKNKTVFISKTECLNNLIRLQKEDDNNKDKLDKLYIKLSNSFKEYSSYYEKYCELKNEFCEIEDQIKKIMKNKLIELFAYFLIIVLILINIIKFSMINLIIETLFLIILVIESSYTMKNLKKMQSIRKLKMKEQASFGLKIEKLQQSIGVIGDQVHDLERIRNKIKNDMRFYKNMQNDK